MASRRVGLFVRLVTLAFFGAACAPQGCESIEQPSRPLPEAQRIYGGVQAHLTSEGFQAGAFALAPGLTSALPESIPITLPTTQVSLSGADLTVCPYGCALSIELGATSLDLAPPSSVLVFGPASIHGSLELSGTVACEVGISGSVTLAAEAAFGPDSITHNLGARLARVSIPVAPDDLQLSSQDCPAGLDLSAVAQAIVDQRAVLEQDALAIAAPRFELLFAMPCETYGAGCPESSTCADDGYCRDSEGAALFSPIGVLGALDPARELPLYRASARTESQIVAGQLESGEANPLIDTGMGLTFRMYGGAMPPETSPACVPGGMGPIRPAPFVDVESEASRLAAEAPALAGGYHLGIALTEPLLSRLLEGFYANGGFCLSADRALSPVLTAGTLTGLLPSLSLFSDSSTPAVLDIRAKAAPRAVIGSGAQDEPLLTVVLEPLELSIYTEIEERFVRVLAVEARVAIPIGVEVASDGQGAAQLKPVIGSMAQAVTDVRVTSNPILAESDEAISAAIASLLGLADVALAGQLPSFALDPVNGIGFEPLALRGIAADGAGGFQAIGAFFNLVPVAAPARSSPSR
jgi:hypothetical protein